MRHKGGDTRTKTGDVASGAKKWPRFGGPEDGHGDDGEGENQVGHAVATLIAKRKADNGTTQDRP